jgi:hypothetical protein
MAPYLPFETCPARDQIGQEILGMNDTGLIDAVVGLVKEALSKAVSFNVTNATTSASEYVGPGLPMLKFWGPSIFTAVITALMIKSTVPPVVVWSLEQAERQLAFHRSVERAHTANIWRYVSSILCSYRYFLVGNL